MERRDDSAPIPVITPSYKAVYLAAYKAQLNRRKRMGGVSGSLGVPTPTASTTAPLSRSTRGSAVLSSLRQKYRAAFGRIFRRNLCLERAEEGLLTSDDLEMVWQDIGMPDEYVSTRSTRPSSSAWHALDCAGNGFVGMGSFCQWCCSALEVELQPTPEAAHVPRRPTEETPRHFSGLLSLPVSLQQMVGVFAQSLLTQFGEEVTIPAPHIPLTAAERRGHTRLPWDHQPSSSPVAATATATATTTATSSPRRGPVRGTVGPLALYPSTPFIDVSQVKSELAASPMAAALARGAPTTPLPQDAGPARTAVMETVAKSCQLSLKSQAELIVNGLRQPPTPLHKQLRVVSSPAGSARSPTARWLPSPAKAPIPALPGAAEEAAAFDRSMARLHAHHQAPRVAVESTTTHLVPSRSVSRASVRSAATAASSSSLEHALALLAQDVNSITADADDTWSVGPASVRLFGNRRSRAGTAGSSSVVSTPAPTETTRKGLTVESVSPPLPRHRARTDSVASSVRSVSPSMLKNRLFAPERSNTAGTADSEPMTPPSPPPLCVPDPPLASQ